MNEAGQTRVCIVGSGTFFLSGISYYTIRLTNELSSFHRVSVILMRRLLPTLLYPGRKRVGAKITDLEYASAVRVVDGVDWHWLPGIFRALALLIRERPAFVVFQWWTGTVLHTYLLLVLVAHLLRAKVVIEFHEVQATEESRLKLAGAYVGLLVPVLTRSADGFVVHSQYDRAALQETYGIEDRPILLSPLGPFDQYKLIPGQACRAAPASCCNLLFFGVIRPFKGLEDLIAAFDRMPEDEIAGYWLTIVGETWEGWELPADLAARSRYRERITFVNRYVRDEEAAAFFSGADAVVLPYHRSSASGPLHVTMSYGLPVVVTNVGGLTEAAAGYEGAVLVPPRDPDRLQQALAKVAGMRGRQYADPHSWERTVRRYEELFARLSQVRDRKARIAA